jgi:hypothetical protein
MNDTFTTRDFGALAAAAAAGLLVAPAPTAHA